MLNKSTYSNITPSIEKLLDRKLHNQKNHPIEIIKNHIYKYFTQLKEYNFDIFDDLNPVVSVEDNFDKLLIDQNHPSRRKTDTYYVNEKEVLRTHTSAHQNQLLQKGSKENQSFLVTGDVYRKDEIDARHYPVFHQMEMFVVLNDNISPEEELKRLLVGLVEYLFPNCEYRFNNDYFPFTSDAYEIEVKFNDKWLEILGCGIVQQKILENNNIINKKAIAAGFGLDRLAMIFGQIPDIRYLWSTHERFLSQFTCGKIVTFKPFSELPTQKRDISFYIGNQEEWLQENDFYEVIRNNSEDMMEEVILVDSYYNKKLDKYSRTYRLSYSSMDPNLKDSGKFFDIVNKIQDELRRIISLTLDVELR